ncbi:hypothetical protein KAR91_69080 [Candidatus Pacearchaeota archaeon]|nr:hypothetical protein [Candidatus Pacearchaeota archaeon]
MAEFNLMSTLIIAVIITAIIAPFIALMFKKKSDKWMPFIARPIEKIYTNGLDDKIKIQGKKLKGARIVHGWDNRNRIDKFYTTKGKMPQFDYDDTTKEYTLIKKKKDPKNKKGDNKKKDDEFQSIEFDFTVFRLKNKSLLWRLFGFKKSYMIIRNKDDNGKKIIKKDDRFNRFFLPDHIDFDVYANVYTESPEARNYLYVMGQLYELQQAQTIVVNTADRYIHLEEENAKRKAILTTTAQIDKNKYEEIKKAEDEVIT